MHRLLFRVSIFVASFVLFCSEPIAARQLLPTFGGSASVWMTCLVFFQVALLLGYLYAHGLSRMAPRAAAALHGGLLVLAVVAGIAWASGRVPLVQAGARPILSIFAALVRSVGLPFLLLASTSPLLQVWLARMERNAVAYRLFALSNAASLVALLGYPTVIEPYLRLSTQRMAWAGGVALFAALTAVIAWRGRAAAAVRETLAAGLAATARERWMWFLLPMAAAMQLAAVTAYLTSNIAAIPLLWILPLAVYLLTFILAFQMTGLRRYRGLVLRLLAVMMGALAYMLAQTGKSLPIGLAILFFLVEAFLACLFLHGETYALRPQRTSESTVFYLTIAAGGAFGSFLVGIAAPLVFSGNYDLAVSFLVTALLVLAVVWNPGEGWVQAWPLRVLWAAGSGLLVFLVFAIHHAYMHQTIVATRNFYGSLRVQQSVTEHGDPIRTLLNGSIEHGTEIFSDDLRHVPTTYYAHDSGVGLALLNCCAGRTKRVGVVGLGAGTLAAYGNAGDTMRFYEINPSVEPIARNLFTWLRDSRASVTIVTGDARTSLAAEPAQGFDVLVLDAFSGDAIPLHLLTVEAMALYRRHLAPGGLLAFHVSNAYIDLAPEVMRLAEASGMEAREVSSEEDKQSGEFRASWVLVTPDRAFFEQPALADKVVGIPPLARVRAWTDDYSSVLALLR